MEDLTEQRQGTASGAEASTRIQRTLDQEVRESRYPQLFQADHLGRHECGRGQVRSRRRP
jgi:N-methylhydantoinase B/oxoprolinase/acetone carboxylase alpha subunit